MAELPLMRVLTRPIQDVASDPLGPIGSCMPDETGAPADHCWAAS